MSRRVFPSFLFLVLIAVPTFAQSIVSESHLSRRYRVTVTNLTPGQGFSPPVVVAHTSAFDLFEVTEAASPGVARVAEEGDPAVAVAEANAASGVLDVQVGGATPFMPGQSRTVEIEASSQAFLSVIGMLGSTNDAFYGLDSEKLTFATPATIYVAAYDAGSERNTEDCDHVPGPPCAAMGVRVTSGAEGFITVHNGIHGFADLPAVTHDWNNPVARITIERIFP